MVVSLSVILKAILTFFILLGVLAILVLSQCLVAGNTDVYILGTFYLPRVRTCTCTWLSKRYKYWPLFDPCLHSVTQEVYLAKIIITYHNRLYLHKGEFLLNPGSKLINVLFVDHIRDFSSAASSPRRRWSPVPLGSSPRPLTKTTMSFTCLG